VNRIKHIAAAAAISAAVLAPVTIAPAFAEPYPGHKSDSASGATKTKAQIEYEERLRLDQGPGPGNEGPASAPTATDADGTGFPWEIVGLTALGAGALAAGGVAVARHVREPRPA
jgi:hypothetical protein